MLERLQKIIARAGIASRRHAEELIRSGQVRVNGVVVTELGAKADPEHDRVEAAGKLAERPAEASYYVLNKPAHVVSTMSDPEGRATLRHLLRGLAGGVFPVGRLDYASAGLVLLTTDGELADKIFKHSSRMPQVYWIKVKGRLSDETLRQVRAQAHAHIRLLQAPGSASPDTSNPWYEVELSEARRDLIRDTLFAMNHPVEKMRRVSLGPLNLGDLPEANYRSLAPSEVEDLRRAIGRAEKAPRTPVSKRIRRFRGKWAATRGANNATSVPPPIDMRSGQAATDVMGRGSSPPRPANPPHNAPGNTHASRPPVGSTWAGGDPRNSYGGPRRSSPGGNPSGRVPPGRTPPGRTPPGGDPRNSYGGPGRSSPGGNPSGRVPPGRTPTGRTPSGGGAPHRVCGPGRS
jgi:23S rRNA pseudouridine2605 synthase